MRNYQCCRQYVFLSMILAPIHAYTYLSFPPSALSLRAYIPNVDPTQRMRHRRASSAISSSQSSTRGIVRDASHSGSFAHSHTRDLSQSSRDFARSRSSSRTSMRLSASPHTIPCAAAHATCRVWGWGKFGIVQGCGRRFKLVGLRFFALF